MATNPDDIRLDQARRRQLAAIADATGRDWTEVFDAFVNMVQLGIGPDEYAWLRAQEQTLATIWNNEEDSIFDDL